MSTVAGFVDFRSHLAPAETCAAMARALRPYSAVATEVVEAGPVAFARNLRLLVSEDRFDRQPLRLASGTAVFVADARIDNRDEVAARLGLSRAKVQKSADSHLLGAAWEAYGEAALDFVIGDVALACWDQQECSLTLARSAFSLKPLFFHESARFLAFASMPAGLTAIPGVGGAPNLNYAARVVAGLGWPGDESIFSDIRTVRHGEVVRLREGNRSTRSTWSPRIERLSNRRPDDLVEQFRDELDRAVSARLRRHEGVVASQLSAGRDSSAVSATAAKLLANKSQPLLTVTGAPREGFDGPTLGDRLRDESELAAEVVAMHRNVESVVCRPAAVAGIGLLSGLHELSDGPMLNPANAGWWENMNGAAAGRGASILLYASAGNFTISAGGNDALRDVLVEEGLLHWTRAAMSAAGFSLDRWRNVAAASLGPSMPQAWYRTVLRWAGRGQRFGCRLPLLRSPIRETAEQYCLEQFHDPRPPESYTAFRVHMLGMRDTAEMHTFARWGLDPRDPTADRRLVEFCLSLPNAELIGRGDARPLYERAMADRLPQAILQNRRRGYQSADWFEHFPPEHAKRALRRYTKNGFVARLLDLDELARRIENWPTTGWDNPAQLIMYRNEVLQALSIANFLYWHFPSGTASTKLSRSRIRTEADAGAGKPRPELL